MNASQRPSGETRAVSSGSVRLQSGKSPPERTATSLVVPSRRTYRLHLASGVLASFRQSPCTPPGASTLLATKYTEEPSSLAPSTPPRTPARSPELSGVTSESSHRSLPASSATSHSYRSGSAPVAPESSVSFSPSRKKTFDPSLEAIWNRPPPLVHLLSGHVGSAGARPPVWYFTVGAGARGGAQPQRFPPCHVAHVEVVSAAAVPEDARAVVGDRVPGGFASRSVSEHPTCPTTAFAFR